VATLLALLLVGCIRRGPYLRFDPPDLGTGFGISGDLFAEPERDIDEPNVLDWEGCSMWSYITLFYVSPPFRSLDHMALKRYKWYGRAVNVLPLCITLH
jgi:hypothetical protein